MTKVVPYLAEEVIERDAAALLAEFARARGITIAPPIPIEDVVEKHLKLGVEFDDTHRLFGLPRFGRDPDILGAMFFDERRIVLDESLDPEENPAKEGRYRFTLAHEGGGRSDQHATDQVLVAVKDSGIGLDPENLDRLFIVTRAPSSRRR
jgi:signal transduction histidine kinase